MHWQMACHWLVLQDWGQDENCMRGDFRRSSASSGFQAACHNMMEVLPCCVGKPTHLSDHIWSRQGMVDKSKVATQGLGVKSQCLWRTPYSSSAPRDRLSGMIDGILAHSNLFFQEVWQLDKLRKDWSPKYSSLGEWICLMVLGLLRFRQTPWWRTDYLFLAIHPPSWG